uniref:Glycoside hydrolase family 38 N-terminal domain-containing protein n=1 Tax=Aegilops tauschii subsp. strangulata TaxID=200361 RepID=A0A453MAQ3_AEGTS
CCRNGGMCMHDEATVHYIDMIDQTTLGHRFIKEEFGQIPRIGWQIDPFGHSAVQAYLLGMSFTLRMLTSIPL